MIKELNKYFSKKREIFKQVYSSDKCYIYERTLEGGKSKCYEVFKKRNVKIADYIRQYDVKGKYEGYDRMEIYPSDNQFGIWAWCYGGYYGDNGALSKAEQINNE